MRQKHRGKKAFVRMGLLISLSILVLPETGLIPPIGPQQIPNVSPEQYSDQSSKKPTAYISSFSASTEQAAPVEPVAQADGLIRNEIVRPERMVVIDNETYPLRTYKTLATPNDPYANQWWVTKTKLSDAWDTPRGTSDSLIAVIDTGFGLQHEELNNSWYTNPGESGSTTLEGSSKYNCTGQGLPLNASCNLVDDDVDGIVDNETGGIGYENPSQLTCTAQGIALNKKCNRLDDDNNGYIDDHTGWDFVNQDNSVQAGQLNPTGTGTTHGTMVAGVAAARGNNGKGIAGVDWGARVLPLQAIDDDSYGDTRSVGRAIRYAASQGADVINLSLGSSLPDPYVKESVQIAIASGAIVVAASGNDGCDCIIYPANYPEVLAVGALAENNAPATFSSWGNNLDMLAPGTNITTPTWRNTNGISSYASGVAGTSFSAPMVSGTISRLLSIMPTASPLQQRALITENLDRLSLGNSQRTSTLGYGSLDAAKAIVRATTPVSPSQLYGFSPISQGSFLNPTKPLEISSGKTFYPCTNPLTATTQIYELKKAGVQFFTASEVEMQLAQTSGYTVGSFAPLCMQLPDDNPSVIRSINIFSEFRNLYTKP